MEDKINSDLIKDNIIIINNILLKNNFIKTDINKIISKGDNSNHFKTKIELMIRTVFKDKEEKII